MDLKKALGWPAETDPEARERLIQYINLKLAALGFHTVPTSSGKDFDEIAAPFLAHHQENERLLASYLCPADARLQEFLDRYFQGIDCEVKLPRRTFLLDRHGLARALSLPLGRDEFISEAVASYRVRQGVLHNPQQDRRTTKGIFHVAEGGLPIPDDKQAVPREVAARLFQHALNPPKSLMRLPFTAELDEPAECFVSLLLRPMVCPAVPGFIEEKSMEIRFLAPGTLVSNLDFVESIFGNAGDPFLPMNDAGTDVDHWTGQSGAVILATHLVELNKKELGLPHWDQASERQRRDGMCWRREDERYNNGEAFKLACRDDSGVMVTLIADNYFGYCKKEVKTQISFSANLFGLCEEEHAGGALVFPSFDLGEEFSGHLHVRRLDHAFDEVIRLYGEIMDLQPEGYGVDKRYPDILYVCEDVSFDLHQQTVSWFRNGQHQHIALLPGKTYVRPSGYKVMMEKVTDGTWRLVGTMAEATLCHKPCTVSGGGKSEISKPITDAILQGPVFVADFKADFDRVTALIHRDYSERFKDPARTDTRSVLSSDRSLGSVIKLLTPSPRGYTAEYNEWLNSIPQYLKELVFVVKRFYKPEWQDQWREHFSVDIVNGVPGNQLKCENRRLVAHYMRVGYDQDGSWRTFGLRQDFHPAAKQSVEDDISVSVVVPASVLQNFNPEYGQPAFKFVKNCEYRLFQRPDDAVHRGYDKQTEADLAREGNFLSNFEPLNAEQARELMEDSIGFDEFTTPMQRLIRRAAKGGRPAWVVCSSHPRLVEGKPTKNPRYLQTRPDLVDPKERYLADVAARLHRRIPLNEPLHQPVNAVVPGRRNNPPDAAAGIRPLAVYNPIHYMELPELFMEFICSMTGKSPSTTGAGSEGALTKGPFNALLPIIDLNNALVSYLLTGYQGYVTAAGHIGPRARFDHDISLLIPEIWCRMSVEERDPRFLINQGYLEPCADFVHKGQRVIASRLGYRITKRFVRMFFGRMFNHPHLLFTEEMLMPEQQDLDAFADGMANIIATQRRVAQGFFDDGSIEQACPPLRTLLHIMREDQHEGRGLDHPAFRSMFTREYLLSSDWYATRLDAQQQADARLWSRHVDYLEKSLSRHSHAEEADRLGLPVRLAKARAKLGQVNSPAYLKQLRGTLGRHPIPS